MTLSMFGHNRKERLASLLVFIVLAMMLTFASVTTIKAGTQTVLTGCGMEPPVRGQRLDVLVQVDPQNPELLN